MHHTSADSGFGLLPDGAWIATRYACPRVESITTNAPLKHNCSYGMMVVLRSKVKMCKGEKMFYLSENLKKYRIMKNLTQEDVAEYLGLTPQSISKWERGECYPDITFLPALANIFETSIDLLIGMDTIRAQETRYNIHKKASEFQRDGDYISAEKVYRDALLIYPNKPGMILGLAGVLALQNKSEEAIELMERGLPISINEKQKATMRATLCFLYLKCGKVEKANALASELPHTRESREVIQPLIQMGLGESEINDNIRNILLGDGKSIW